MSKAVLIPMFPLTVLPLPGELVPLHIFEPRYKALLVEAETNDISFGIYFNHELNVQKIGSLMKLESVLKRYPNGESDIVVKCVDVFTMDILYRLFKDRPYPGGDVHLWKMKMEETPGENLYTIFLEYMSLRNIRSQSATSGLYQIAHALSLDFLDRYNFLLADQPTQEKILTARLKFLIHVLHQEIRSKDVFHLN